MPEPSNAPTTSTVELFPAAETAETYRMQDGGEAATQTAELTTQYALRSAETSPSAALMNDIGLNNPRIRNSANLGDSLQGNHSRGAASAIHASRAACGVQGNQRR